MKKLKQKVDTKEKKTSLKKTLILNIVPLFVIGEILAMVIVGSIFYFYYGLSRDFTSTYKYFSYINVLNFPIVESM